LQRLKMETIDPGVVGDEPAALEEALDGAAAQADAVITTGGASADEADHVRALTAKLGSVHFWCIQIKPGRPMAFGRTGGAWLNRSNTRDAGRCGPRPIRARAS
jgi:molybdopterin molybdotransferase